MKHLKNTVQSISDLILKPGMINIDFNDLRLIIAKMGKGQVSVGKGKGKNRVKEATELALNTPYSEDLLLSEARGILVNITSGLDLSLGDFSKIGDIIENHASDSATIVIGTVLVPTMVDSMTVSIVATGIDSRGSKRKRR